ncbi:MAG: hypothetical protein ACI4C5_01140, partial [Lachnospiraceae bacterium]
MTKTTMMAMVAEQKATGREVIGLIAERKNDDNRAYSLTNYDAEAGVLEFTEIVDEGNDVVPKTVKVTKDNDKIMRYICNPNEKPVPDAKLLEKGGKKFLEIERKEISLGTLDVIRVVGGTKGEVFLAVPSKTDKDRVDIIRYIVQTDEIKDGFMENVSADVKIVNMEDKVFIINNVIENVPQTDKDGNPILDENGEQIVRQKCLAAEIAMYDNGFIVSELRAGECIADDDYDDDYDDDKVCVPFDSVRIISQGVFRKDLVVVTTKKFDDDGYLVDAEEATIRLFTFGGTYIGSRVGTFYVKDPKAQVFLGGSFKKPPVVTVKDEDKILIRDAFGLKVVDDANVVVEMDGYNDFLGTEVSKDEKDRDVVKFSYGNKTDDG